MTQLGGYAGNVRDAIQALRPPGISPATFYRSNIDRIQAMSNAAALSSGVMTSVPIWLNEGEVVTSVRAVSATTAANTPTNQWAALYDPSGSLVAQTPDLTTAAWAANTAKTFTFTTPVTIEASGWYRVAVMVTATAAPTLAGVALHNAVLSAALVTSELPLSATSGSTLTTTAPATIGTLTAIAAVPLVILI